MTALLPVIGRSNGVLHDLNADQRWTASELATQVARRAAVLSALPTHQGRTFALLHANSLHFFADLFAIWSVGGTAACLNPGLTRHELDIVLNHLQPVAVLVDDTDLGVHDHLVLDLAREAPPRTAQPAQTAVLDDPALVLFTSGTTGAPKGVVLSHRALLARLALNCAEIGTDTLSKSLSVLPTHFGHGLIGNALTPLSAGGSLWLMPDAGIAGAARLGEIIDTNGIRFMSSVPSFWNMALRVSEQPALETLRRIHIGSAPLSATLWQDIIAWSQGANCANTYGITEAANWIAGASNRQHAPEDGLVGQVWGGIAAIKTETGRAATGEGEVLLQTPSLMSGYLERPDLTADVMEDGWYNTGDIGQLDDSGTLRLIGRSKHMINRGGSKLYPEEFDLLLERHEAIAEACAFAIPDPIGGEALAVAVTPNDAATLSEEDIMAWLRDRVRTEALPAKIYFVDAVPRTSRGKVNRATVADYCKRQEAVA